MRNSLFCLVLLLVVIGMVACSGDDTEVEVILEPKIEVTPEPVEEVIPEPIPEPVVETVYVPTLESWGIEDGELEIVNGNCNLPIFKKAPFPRAPVMEEIRAETGAVSGGGPECLDDDNEGSRIKVACVSETNLGGFFVYCLAGHPDYVNDPVLSEIDVPQLCEDKAEEGDGECVLTYYDPNNPRPLSIVDSGRTNFYDNLFKRSFHYVNTRGEERVYTHGRRSFIMVKTHIGGSLRSPSGDAVAGKLYGNYNPDSEEYDDRKRLWDECEIGTNPQIGSGREDDRRENGINGEWQATKRNGYIEVCIRLDTLPGAVKCFVDNPDGAFVELHTRDNSPKIVVDTDEMDERFTVLTISLFSNNDFRRNKLCELFDEG